MKWINDYLLRIRYVDGGRGPAEYDCWGLVREARHAHCGKRLLPSWGEIRNTQPKEFTKAYQIEAENMEVCEPEHGAVAAVFIGKLCVHVGLVVEVGGRLHAIEINKGRGVNFSRLVDFEAQYLKVIYYRD